MEPWHLHGYYGYESNDLPIQSPQRQSLNTTKGHFPEKESILLTNPRSFDPKSKVKEGIQAKDWSRANMPRKPFSIASVEINTVHTRDTHLSAMNWSSDG